MKTIDNIRWQLDGERLAPRTAAAVILALALLGWAAVMLGLMAVL